MERAEQKLYMYHLVITIVSLESEKRIETESGEISSRFACKEAYTGCTGRKQNNL